MELEKLPADVLQLVLRFLTGYDAFYLSHTSSRLLRLLSDDGFWLARLSLLERLLGDQGGNGKRRYVESRSLQFMDSKPALRSLIPRRHWDSRPSSIRQRSPFAHLSSVTTNEEVHLKSRNHRPFSFSLWFALLPATGERPAGGIIYGMQSAGASRRSWPHYHQQIVIVDSQRNLYCSVLDLKKVVASDLEVNRWYHLALTYNTESREQDVYVDGANIWSTTGRLHHEWQTLAYEQIGTGCVTAGDLHFPNPGNIGWYSFNGVIDDFCLYLGVWTADEVAGLASSTVCWAEGNAHVSAVLHSSGGPEVGGGWANAHAVRCTRPAEGRQLCLQESRVSYV